MSCAAAGSQCTHGALLICLSISAAQLQIDGVSFIAQTIAARQVAVVLDLDATLLESEHLPVEPAGW